MAILVALGLALPATAQAADVTLDNTGKLTYTASPGHVNNVTFVEAPTGTVTIERIGEDGDPFGTVTGCATTSATVLTCVGVKHAAIDAGDDNDRVTATSRDSNNVVHGLTSVSTDIHGGEGADALDGGAVTDSIDGGPGDDLINGYAGDDTLSGGDGNDTLTPNNGTDRVVGGDGIDTAVYGLRPSPTYSLDGLANDGGAGENDLIGVDVENVEAAAELPSQTVTMTGDGRGNWLSVSGGRAIISGGEGADVLEGGAQDDTITSRDGSPDTVICNGGTDSVIADTLDLISPSCENVQRQASPGGPFDDHPPALAWSAPAAGADITANGATTLSVNASDDRGVARVQFFDDDRQLCEDTTAPYTCAYQPRGADVGRNTLVAVAIDGANQTTSVVRAVAVRRFTPRSLSLSLRPARDRKKPYSFRVTGRLQRPDPVSPSQGCSGTITITAKRGTKAVSTKRVTLSRTCEYKSTFKFNMRPSSRLRFSAKFGGNETLATDTSKTRTARLG